MGTTVTMPIIAINDFLPIFLASSFVLIFGVFYVALYTLVKMGKISKVFMPFAYMFWLLQTYCMYYFSDKIGSSPFVVKVLAIALICYLILPHLYYYINFKAEKKYK